jgi:PAS domain S-box-containing protein
MDANYPVAPNNKKFMTEDLVLTNKQAAAFFGQIKERSDRLINYFLAGHFLLGIILASYYDTWLIAFGVGSISLTAYYSARLLLPGSSLYQYVLSAVLGIFMAQYIYQMHGMFEMHFFAFIGSAILITYQKWKLQIPIMIVVFVHHAVFSYLHNVGFSTLYFTQLDYFDLQTFVIHILLAMTIFFVCGLWAFQLKKYSEIQILQTIKLAEFEKQAQISVERKIKEKALEERNTILESIGDAFFAVDKSWTVTYWNNVAEKTLHMPKSNILGKNLWEAFPGAMGTPFYAAFEQALTNNLPQHFEASYHGAGDWYETSIYPSENGLTAYIKDISDRKASEIQLKKLNDDLKEQAKELEFSNAELEQFAYVASHDLQEPLRMVTSFMTQLERKYGDIIDERGKQYIHFAVDGGKRMRQIILDLLSYSRVGRTDDKLENVDINCILDETKILFRKTIEEHNAIIEYHDLPALRSFSAPLRQVFQNLVGNALKYQQPGTAPLINITATELSAHWRFSISDNGIGINEADFEKIFVIFQRLHTGSDYSGTGLGLAITKKIVENLGGKISVTSEEGKGSTFTFTIAKTEAAYQEEQLTDNYTPVSA